MLKISSQALLLGEPNLDRKSVLDVPSPFISLLGLSVTKYDLHPLTIAPYPVIFSHPLALGFAQFFHTL